MIYERFLRDKLDDISFLELKEGRSIELGGRKFYGYLPLPIRSDLVVNLVKDDIDSIPLEYFLEGFIHILALDKENSYLESYIKILEAYYKDLEGYLLRVAIENSGEEDYDQALVEISALINLGIRNERSLFTLGSILENLDISSLSLDDRRTYIVEIMNIYEEILNLNPEFPLAYYKLAHIYRAFDQYQKAKLALERFIKLDTNDFRIQEARNLLEEIRPLYILELAIQDLERGDLDQALERIKSLDRKVYSDLHYYYLAYISMNKGDLAQALDYTKMAIAMEDTLAYRNQLALVYHASGKIKEAIRELEEALEKFGSDYNLIINLGTIYYNEKKYKKALENFRLAYEIEASEELKNLIDKIEKENIGIDNRI